MFLNRLIKALAWTTLFRLIGVLSAFMINVLLARLFSPDVLGQYFLAFSFVMLITLFMRFGSKQSTMRLVSHARNDNSKLEVAVLIRQILKTGIFTALFFGAVLIVGVGDWVSEGIFHSVKISESLILLIVWGIVTALSAPIGESLRALHYPAWGVSLDMSMASMGVLFVLTSLLMLEIHVSFEQVLLLWIVVTLLLNIVALMKLERVTDWFSSGYSSVVGVVGILKHSYLNLFHNLSTFMMANVTLWVAGWSLGYAQVADYGIAIKLFNLVALPLLIINLGIEPYITDLLKRGQKKQLESLLRLTATFALVLTLLISIILMLIGEWGIEFLFGHEYKESYVPLMILLFGNIVNVWTGSCSNILLLSGEQKLLAKINFIGALFALSVSSFLVQTLSINGAAITVVISITFVNLVTWLWVLKKIEINPGATIKLAENYRNLKRIN